tara:strand:+ start:1891 stop:2073 length:183 start_codon:yes stop_codon:yes gene_type:complete
MIINGLTIAILAVYILHISFLKIKVKKLLKAKSDWKYQAQELTLKLHGSHYDGYDDSLGI